MVTILKEWGERMWTGFNSLRRSSSDGLFQTYGKASPEPIKREAYRGQLSGYQPLKDISIPWS
jgi:hypothetical protein